MYKIIDVSEFNGSVDWPRVAQSVDGAIIRAGYRGWGSGRLAEDAAVRKNLQGAISAGLPVGLYIVTQAITKEEAIEEAMLCTKLAEDYPLTLPICWDTELAGGANGHGRGDLIDKNKRSSCAAAFHGYILESGYIAALYCSDSWYSTHVDGALLRKAGMLSWIASYPARRGGIAAPPKNTWDGWQFSDCEQIAGIVGNVDMSYFRKETLTVGKHYSDTAGHWAEAAIDRCTEAGLLKGKTETTFDPNGTITRAELATVLSRMLDRIGQ